MNLYIKKVKNSKGEIKEWLWINFTVEGKRCRKPLKLENTKNNYKKAIKEILPTLKYKLLNGELKKVSKEIPTINQFIEYSFELHKGERTESTIYGHRKNYDKYIKNIFENKTIQVQRQIVNGNIKNILKTSHSNRIIPIIDSLLFFLQEQYKLTGKDKSFIFLTEKTNKHYHSAGKVREQVWLKLFNKIDIEYRNLHQTRGTFISTLISNGEDINYVSKIAGHESVKVTLEKYSQYIPAPNKDFGKCFNKVLANNDTELALKEKGSL